MHISRTRTWTRKTLIRASLVSCSVSSLPKTRRESTPCCVTNPQQVPNLLPVRALPDADFAGFPTGVRGYASTQSGLLQHADIDKKPTEQDTRHALKLAAASCYSTTVAPLMT